MNELKFDNTVRNTIPHFSIFMKSIESDLYDFIRNYFVYFDFKINFCSDIKFDWMLFNESD